MNFLWILVLKNLKVVELFKKPNAIFFSGLLQDFFLIHQRKKDIYEMECLSTSSILNFPLLVLSLFWEALNWISLERFSLCFSSGPLMACRRIHSEYSSNGRCCHPITQSSLCHNCSCLLRGWHAIRSRRGQGRQTGSNSSSQGIGTYWWSDSSGTATNNPLSANSRLIHPSTQQTPNIYQQELEAK